MAKICPEVNGYEYWDLRLRLFDLQRRIEMEYVVYEELKRDLIEDLHNYLITQEEEEEKEQDPWS